MKSFSELITWELEQEQNQPKQAISAGKKAPSYRDSLSRKLRYLSAAQRKADRSSQSFKQAGN
ncbi:MAG: hypothetical protein ACTHMT_12780 [Verrucomicrobiota bacterium]|jgi:hypothetical protein